MNEKLIKLAEELKRDLISLDHNLDLYYDDSTQIQRELFIDCKLDQQNALDKANEIMGILKF